MKLYLIHAGYYDPEIMDGLYEQHTNFFVVGKNVKDAKKKVRQNSTYENKKMHIDGIQELNAVDGYRIQLVQDDSAGDKVIYSYDEVKKIL